MLGRGEQLGRHEALRGAAGARRTSDDNAVRRHELHEVGADPRLMLAQRRHRGVRIVGRKGLAERDIAGQRRGGLLQPGAVLFEQAPQDALVGRELPVDHAARVVRVGRVDQEERGSLDQREQHGEEHDDPSPDVPQPGRRKPQHVAAAAQPNAEKTKLKRLTARMPRSRRDRIHLEEQDARHCARRPVRRRPRALPSSRDARHRLS